MRQNQFQQQGGWSFFELVMVMAIMALLIGLSASWLGGRTGMAVSTQRDQTVMALRHQQLSTLSNTSDRQWWRWDENQISGASSILFGLSNQTHYFLPDELKNRTWYWDSFGRFRGEDDQILCVFGCEVVLMMDHQRSNLCVYGEGGIWPSRCHET